MVVWTSVSNILGNALGSAIPGFVVSRATEAADIEAQLIGQALFVTVLLAATLVALYPPAACRCAGDGDAAADAGKGGSEDNDEWRDAARRMLRDSAALMRTRAYWPLWVAVAVGVGLSISLLTLVAQMIGPCGYGADAASLLGGALLVVGIVCAGVTGALLTKWPRLQMPIMRSLVFVLAAALVGSLACLRRGVLGPLAVTWAAMGGAMIPLLPVSLQARRGSPLRSRWGGGEIASRDAAGRRRWPRPPPRRWAHRRTWPRASCCWRDSTWAWCTCSCSQRF